MTIRCMDGSMKAVRIHDYGGLDVLRIEDAPLPVIRDDEARVRIVGASVNPIDRWYGQFHGCTPRTTPSGRKTMQLRVASVGIARWPAPAPHLRRSARTEPCAGAHFLDAAADRLAHVLGHAPRMVALFVPQQLGGTAHCRGG